MKMSASCSPPINPSITPQDMRHPRYREYLTYRMAMSRQLVSCMSFQRWLSQEEEAERIEEMNANPRVSEWRRYLKAYHTTHNSHKGALDFYAWLGSLHALI